MLIEIINGKIIEISTSKIKKIIVIIKNWIEKDSRVRDLGSNPHSKGDIFSWSKLLFFEIINEIKIIKLVIIKINIIIFLINKIIYIKFLLNFLIGN